MCVLATPITWKRRPPNDTGHALFGRDFRRSDSNNAINAILNYGYAVLRAATARAIVASGLIPSLGVHHRNRSNPFCLADDLLEPYRPFVDWRTKQLIDHADCSPPSIKNRPTRVSILSLLNETVLVGDRRLPLLMALHTTAISLCRLLTEGEKRLLLPDGLPLAADCFDQDAP